jgi:hypothetical protein
VAALTVVSVVWLVIDRRGGREVARKIVGLVLVALSIGVTALTFLVGHSGAEATWAGRIGTTQTPVPTDSPTAAPTDPAPGTLTAAEVSRHATPDDCWTIIDGGVYDMTPFLNQHPGGSNAIIGLCGHDGTAGFRGQHGSQSTPNSLLEALKIGVLGAP